MSPLEIMESIKSRIDTSNVSTGRFCTVAFQNETYSIVIIKEADIKIAVIV